MEKEKIDLTQPIRNFSEEDFEKYIQKKVFVFRVVAEKVIPEVVFPSDDGASEYRYYFHALEEYQVSKLLEVANITWDTLKKKNIKASLPFRIVIGPIAKEKHDKGRFARCDIVINKQRNVISQILAEQFVQFIADNPKSFKGYVVQKDGINIYKKEGVLKWQNTTEAADY